MDNNITNNNYVDYNKYNKLEKKYYSLKNKFNSLANKYNDLLYKFNFLHTNGSNINSFVEYCDNCGVLLCGKDDDYDKMMIFCENELNNYCIANNCNNKHLENCEYCKSSV